MNVELRASFREVDFQHIDYFEHTDDSILQPGEAARIQKIDAGENFSAAMSEQGELWVWGRNDYGQLGLGEEVRMCSFLKIYRYRSYRYTMIILNDIIGLESRCTIYV